MGRKFIPEELSPKTADVCRQGLPYDTIRRKGSICLSVYVSCLCLCMLVWNAYTHACSHVCRCICTWRSAVDVWCLSLVLYTSLLGWGLLLNSKLTDLGGWRQSDRLRDLLCLPPEFSVSGLPFMWVPRIQTLLLHLHSKDFILGNHPHGSIFRLRWAHKSRWNETREGGKQT